MAGETTGWGGKFSLHNGTILTELLGVTECGIPTVKIDQLDVTPLAAAGGFKQYIGGLKDGGEFPVTMNYVPRSPTDLLCQAQLGKVRSFKIVEPGPDGLGVQQIDGVGLVTGYEPSPMKPNEPRTAVLTIKVSGQSTYSVPV